MSIFNNLPIKHIKKSILDNILHILENNPNKLTTQGHEEGNTKAKQNLITVHTLSDRTQGAKRSRLTFSIDLKYGWKLPS